MSDTKQASGGSWFGSALAYLALVPVVAAVGVGGYFGVRLALSGGGGSGGGGGGAGVVASTSDELMTVDVVAERAAAHLAEDRPQRARELLLSGLERFGGEQRLWLLYAETMLGFDDREAALASFETAIELGPDHPEYRHAAGVLAAELDDPETAEIHFTTAQRLDPEDPRFPFYLAQVQRNSGRDDAARANLVIATRLNPDLAEAWGTLGAIALDQNNIGPALGYLERARSLEPGRSLWRVLEARAHRRNGEPGLGADVLLAMEEFDVFSDPVVLREAGMCFGMMREPGTAAQLYVNALKFHAARDELISPTYDGAGELVSDGRSTDAFRGMLHYEAALWFERAGNETAAVANARLGAGLGSAEAAALRDRLEAEVGGVDEDEGEGKGEGLGEDDG